MTLSSLSRRGEFELLKTQGVRFSKDNLTLVFTSSPTDSVKFAVSTPKKSGCAVRRNKFRRRARECFRIYSDELICGSYLIAANSSSITMDFRDIVRVLQDQQSFLKAKRFVR